MTRTTLSIMDGSISTVILLFVLGCKGTLVAKQRSTYNGDMASYAIDRDSSTCAVTGFDFRPWWKVDLGVTKSFGSITVQGRDPRDDPPNIHIRVGPASGLGKDDEHLRNDICAAWPDGPVPLSRGLTFQCSRNLTGQHVTIETTGVEGNYLQLVLCEVYLNFL